MRFFLIAIFSLIILQCSQPLPAAKVQTSFPESYTPGMLSFPGKDWNITTPEQAGFSPAGLAELKEYLFTRTGSEEDRTGIRTNSILVIKDGKILLEEYARGFTKEHKHITWSVTKSYINVLAGMLVQKGLLSPEKNAGEYYSPLNQGRKKEITVRHLLEMSSGLQWSEGYESSPVFSDVIAMLYTLGKKDMAHYTARRALKYKPGTRWYYSSGETNLLSKVLIKAAGGLSSYEALFEELADRTGMESYTIERDGSGNFVGSSYLYATPRDMARLGLLYLNQGKWNQDQIVSPDWVRYSTTMAKAYYSTKPDANTLADNPGAYWWLNHGVPEWGQAPPLPHAPTDTFWASGHWGQRIIVIPSEGLVIVRTADDRDDFGNEITDNTIRLVLKAKLSQTGANP